MIRRKQLKVGMLVEVVKDGGIVRGYIKQVIPPEQPNQPIEVELKSGVIGTIERIVTRSELNRESFRFYNLFFHSRHLLTIHHKFTKEIYITDGAAYIFSDEGISKKVLEELNDDNLAIRRISRQKPIIESFDNSNITKFRLDESMIVSKQRIKKLEEYFKKT